MALQSNTELCQDLERHQRFEDLLLELSAHFINLPPETIDEAIEDAQRRICECLDLDLSALWQWSDTDRDILTITHLYSPPYGPDLPVGIDGSKSFPWLYDQLQVGKALAFSTEEMPDEAHVDKKSRRYFGVKSSVAIPLKAGGREILGILSFDTLRNERQWSEREVTRLKLIAEVFTSSLARKQSELELVEGEAKLSLAAESAEAGLWEFNCTTGLFWSTEQACRIFGYELGETISMERFEQSVYTEDLEEVRRALSDSFATRNKLKVEYRITSPQPGLKWICSMGRPYYHHDGSPSRMLGFSVDISERKQLEQDLKRNLAEVDQLKKQLEQENYYLREDLRQEQGFQDVIGHSKQFHAVLTAAKQVASTAATVLLLGKTGTGKGVVADIVHQMSDRRDKPFVTVNCAALPHNLIESELFGREKGAFTGAHTKQMGRFEVANRGTIFLDEIGEMGLEIQTKLLRVLQEGKFERLGSPRSVKVDVRVIAATSRDLKEDVRNGRFREDLFYRINVFPIIIPPLMERREDIPLLAQHFVEKYARKMGKNIDRIPKTSLERMLEYPWPGNVRELEHLIERSVIISSDNSLTLNDEYLAILPTVSGSDSKDLESVARVHIHDVLSQTDWKIEGPGGAAEILNINPSTLRFKMKKLDIERPT